MKFFFFSNFDFEKGVAYESRFSMCNGMVTGSTEDILECLQHLPQLNRKKIKKKKRFFPITIYNFLFLFYWRNLQQFFWISNTLLLLYQWTIISCVIGRNDQNRKKWIWKYLCFFFWEFWVFGIIFELWLLNFFLSFFFFYL